MWAILRAMQSLRSANACLQADKQFYMAEGFLIVVVVKFHYLALKPSLSPSMYERAFSFPDELSFL